MLLSNNIYDALKLLVTLVLPALGTLYFTLSQIWGLPYGEEVVGTVVAISTALGAMLKISSKQYDQTGDGELQVDTKSDNPFMLVFDRPLSELASQKQVVLKVTDSQN